MISIVSNINANVESMKTYYVKTIDQHGEWIKELKLSDRLQDSKIQHNDQELDYHIEHIKK
jgi:hypothetical protein